MIPQAAQFEDIKLLENKLKASQLPQDLYQKATALVDRLTRSAQMGNSGEYESVVRYLDWITALPWRKKTEDTLSLENAKKIMDANHHGLENIKEWILEYISVIRLKSLQSQSEQRAQSLLMVGLVGTGKTSISYSIAQALGRHFGRIPMGGMGDALQLRGRARSYPDAEPGQIIKVLRHTQVTNPVILLDEIDRVADAARADIMGVLVELLDPEQNSRFLDHFIDYPINLSEVLFIATANNTTNIAAAVMDRLEVIEMPSYTDEQKIIIAKNYLLPRAITACGLAIGDLAINDNVWPQIVRPLGYDAGMRTLDRAINTICRKVAKQKVQGIIDKQVITVDNLKEYIPTF